MAFHKQVVLLVSLSVISCFSYASSIPQPSPPILKENNISTNTSQEHHPTILPILEEMNVPPTVTTSIRRQKNEPDMKLIKEMRNLIDHNLKHENYDLHIGNSTCSPAGFPGMEAGIRGYNLMQGDIYDRVHDPGFKSRLFKPTKADKTDDNCHKPTDGISLLPKMSCQNTVDAHTYASYSEYIKSTEKASASNVGLQVGLEQSVKASVKKGDAEVSSAATIPPSFTAGYGNSKSSGNMKAFFSSESGFGIIVHAECILHHMKISQMPAPEFTENLKEAIRLLYKATDKDELTQRQAFMTFINNYGTHFFTEMVFGASIIYEEKFSEHMTKNITKETITECSKKKASFLFFAKEEKSKCTQENESSIEEMQSSKYDAVITTRGSQPNAMIENKPGRWFDQDFVPEPIRYQLSPIVNLFTDSLVTQNISVEMDGKRYEEPVEAVILRDVYAHLYYNYCGPNCGDCFIAHCASCSIDGETRTCDRCEPEYRLEDNGKQCRALRQLYVIGDNETEVFYMHGSGNLEHAESNVHTSKPGCNSCAYAVRGAELYMAYAVRDEAVQEFQSDVTDDAQEDPQPNEKDDVKNDPQPDVTIFTPPNEYRVLSGLNVSPFLSFILRNRLYVMSNAGGQSNLHSRSLAGSGTKWRSEIALNDDLDDDHYQVYEDTARSGVVHKDVVYLTGGKVDGNANKDVYTWTPGHATWEKANAVMQYEQYNHCNVLVKKADKKMYIYTIGGTSHSRNKIKIPVQYYDIMANKWHVSRHDDAACPTTAHLYKPSCVALDTNVYVHHSRSIYKYDTKEETFDLIYTMGKTTDASAMIIV